MRLSRKNAAASAALLVLAAAGFGFFLRSGKEADKFLTAAVNRGDLMVSISATGTVEPTDVIDVGAQVAGRIQSFGTDSSGGAIDYGSQVEADTVLAEIDPSLYRAALAEAEAQVQRARAELEQSHVKQAQAERDWNRAKRIGSSQALAASALDAYQASYESAVAAVNVAAAALASSEAGRERAQLNLQYCTIRSPVRGVIIDRRVNIGQTVVASLNAPSLFLIAKDLRRMQVWVAVNEADIGSIFTGQPVRFSVDAFPGEEFQGTVGKIRLNAVMTQNVVSYTVEVNTDNSPGRLLPYLTANVSFEIANLRQVLLVPNAALRVSIPPALIQPGAAAPGKKEKSAGRTDSGQTAAIWVPAQGFARPITVQILGSDGGATAVESSEISENMPVITGVREGEAPATQATNPFTPSWRRRG